MTNEPEVGRRFLVTAPSAPPALLPSFPEATLPPMNLSSNSDHFRAPTCTQPHSHTPDPHPEEAETPEHRLSTLLSSVHTSLCPLPFISSCLGDCHLTTHVRNAVIPEWPSLCSLSVTSGRAAPTVPVPLDPNLLSSFPCRLLSSLSDCHRRQLSNLLWSPWRRGRWRGDLCSVPVVPVPLLAAQVWSCAVAVK